MKNMLAASKDAKQISTEQNSTCVSQNTWKTREKLPCSSKSIFSEENKLVCLETSPEHHNSLESFVKNKNREVSSKIKDYTRLSACKPILYKVITTVNEATDEQKSSKASTHFKKTYSALNIIKKKKGKIGQTDPSAVTALKSNVIESLTSSIHRLQVSQRKEGEQQGKPYESVVSPVCTQNHYSYPTLSPMTEEIMKFNEPAVNYKIISRTPLILRRERKKGNCSTNSVASGPMNNNLVTEAVPVEKRIRLMNSDKEPSQKTISLSMAKKVHPTTVTIRESVPGVQKLVGVQKSICSAETQSVQESASVYKPAAVTLYSTNTRDNKNTQTLKVVSLSKNISANLIDTAHDSATLNKWTEVNLNKIKQTKVLNLNNSNKSVPPLLVCSNLKQPVYRLEFSDKCKNSVGLSGQQLNYPMQTMRATTNKPQLVNTSTIPILYKSTNNYNYYYFANKSENISIPIKTGIRYTMIRCNPNRPKEIKIAPKILNETAVSGSSINLQPTKPQCSGTNTQPENNVNKKQIRSLTLVNSNRIECPPLLPLAEETKKAPVIEPVQEYPEIKIVDVRTNIVNKQDITGVSSSTDDIVQVKPSETDSKGISKSTNDLVQIKSPEIKIVGTPKNINDVQILSSKTDTMNQDSNASQVPHNTDVQSPISESIDPEPRIFQVEVQVPQTIPETTQQQEKPNPRMVEQDKAMLSAMKNMSNAIAARQIIKKNKAVSEKRKLMLLEKEALQKRRIDMLQHVFQVLNHCARMCENEDFEIWFKKEEAPTNQSLKDVQGQQEVTHTITENPGEWVGLLSVSKVGPVSENKTPKRRRSSKTVTTPERNCSEPEVVVCGSVQKRKLNFDDDVTVLDLPGTSPKIRKVESNDLAMIESSSSIVSSEEPAGNLALSTTEVQEVNFMTDDDQNLGDDELKDDGETSKTDEINDSQIGMSLRRRKIIPRTLKTSERQKKHEISTDACEKLGRSRKWITKSSKNDESEFTFTEDVTVKSEDVEIKPDVNNYDTWNDGILCQDFGIRECYVRLRKIEDLYPSGYSCIDFDAIFS